jgi:hypothetical protein
MIGLCRWLGSNGLRLVAFATTACSVATAAFVWYLWTRFEIKSQALARAGSASAEYMRVATTVLGNWVLPALIVISLLAMTTFAVSMRRAGRRLHEVVPAEPLS